MAIPLIALMGKPADSVDQYSAGALNAANIRKTEAEANASADARKTQVFQQVGGALKGLEGLPPEQQAAGFERIKALALRTWGDNPDVAAQIEPLTVANLPDLYSMFTTYEDQMKTAGQMAKDDATVRYTDAGTSLRGAQEGDITIDNRRADWNTGSMIADRNARTGIYASGVYNSNANRDAATELARQKAQAGAFGQLPDGNIMQDGVAAPIPGYVAPAGAGGKPPAGFRYTQSGDLEFIPGGPADPSVLKPKDAQAAREKADKAKMAVGQRADVAKRVIGKVDEALGALDNQDLRTGLGGSLTSVVPGSGAYRLRSTLDTIKANLGFAELAAMRAASPTGGALGAISERELSFLQSTVASLDPNQGEEALRQNLQQIRESYSRWLSTVEQGSSGNTPTDAGGGDVFRYDAEGNPL